MNNPTDVPTSSLRMDSDPKWETPFGGFSIGDPFESPEAMFKEIMYSELHDEKTKADAENFIKLMVETYYKETADYSIDSAGNSGVASYAYEDTSVGGCEVINPLWQFGIDDDIVPEVNQLDSDGNGLGRVYCDMYRNNQHILWLTFGKPKFNSIKAFYSGAVDKGLIDVLTSSDTTFARKLGTIVGSGIGLAITLPILPFVAFGRLMTKISGGLYGKVYKYYEFKPAMANYYKVVNTILASLSVNMNLGVNQSSMQFGAISDPEEIKAKHESVDAAANERTALDKSTSQLTDDPRVCYSKDELDAIAKGVPYVLKCGPDIIKILNRRNVRKYKIQNLIKDGFRTGLNARAIEDILQGVENENPDVVVEVIDEKDLTALPTYKKMKRDKLLIENAADYQDGSGQKDVIPNQEITKDAIIAKAKQVWAKITHFVDETVDATIAKALGDLCYVGIRIERGTAASESVGNSSGPSEVAQKIKSLSAERASKRFDMAGGNTGIGIIDGVVDLMQSALSAVASTVKLDGLSDLVTKGSGYLDFPDVWQDSSFSKSYTFDIQLRAKYGDPLTVYQSIYIPLALIMAGAFPLGIGKNSYTAPFLLQAYSKGMFSVPMGVMESMTITRGASENGWTHAHLPTVVDISISIKDLSPAMFLSVTDKSLLEAFRANTSMQDYMSTLAGVSLADRTHSKTQFLRKNKIAMLLFSKTTFSMDYWTTKIGTSGFIRGIASFAPRNRWAVPND